MKNETIQSLTEDFEANARQTKRQTKIPFHMTKNIVSLQHD